jgi:hypothetical protein
MRLYELDERLSLIEEALIAGESEGVDEATGEVFDLAHALDSLKMDREEKLKGIHRWILSLRAEIQAIKMEEERLEDRRKWIESREKSIKDYITECLKGQKWSVPGHTFSFRPSKKVYCNVPVEELPIEYRRLTEEPDLAAIKEALKAGEVIEGCLIKEFKNLQVK